jgi:hypothetical protein
MMNNPPFFAIYTGRESDRDADLLVIFANRDERTTLDVDGTRQNLESEGETVHVREFNRLADIPDVLQPKSVADIFPGPAGDYLMNRAQLEAIDPFGSEQAVENHFKQPREEREFVGDEVMSRPHTKLEAVAAMKALHGFIGESQRSCLADAMRGEEKQFFFDKLCELADRVAKMPETYQTEGHGDDAIVHLHYFAGGEDFHDGDVTKFGVHGVAEVGPAGGLVLLDGAGGALFLRALVFLGDEPVAGAAGGELDLYFTPKPLKECKKC